MSRHTTVRAVHVAAAVFGLSLAGSASAQEAITVDVSALEANGCFGQAACAVAEVSLATGSGSLAQKDRNGASGFGVSGNPAGNEIGIGETLSVEVDNARTVGAIQFLFLYNGSEFGSSAEKASVTADGTAYILSVRNNADDAEADWSGPGTVTKCGATTSQGTGCFIVTDPFPDAVSRLDFSAAAGGPPFSGGGSGDSDYAIGSIDIEAQIVVDLAGECAEPFPGCVVKPGFNLHSVHASNPGGSTEALAIPVIVPDCRYIPRTCLDQLGLDGDAPASDDAARAALISLGVIKSLAPTGPNKLHPATQLFKVNDFLTTEVTTLFDASGEPPDGLPPLWIDNRWKAQSAKNHFIYGFFFKTAGSVQFTDVFEGEINVLQLTGSELGCDVDPNDLTDFDVIATASELARSIAGQHVDTIINTGCINPTKVSGTRLSLYSILEMTQDTYGPTITSSKPLVTVDNDAVFARLVASLWTDLGEIRANYACKQADPVPAGGQAPLAPALCKTLASLWSQTDRKVKACVDATFNPITGLALGICDQARKYVDDFGAALPATTTRPDPYNRLGELHGRVKVYQHIWDTRFLQSIKLAGFCAERGTCAP
ncbi:MAG: hypothetical protein WD793_03520 [Steroidobacteraceae bacterium]